MNSLPSSIFFTSIVFLGCCSSSFAQDSNDISCKSIPIQSDLDDIASIPPFLFCTDQPLPVSPSASTVSAGFLAQLVQQNPLVESYGMQVKSSEYGLSSANGAWWPSISMSNSSALYTNILNYQNYGGSPTTPSSPATSGTSFNPFNGSTTRDRGRGRSSGELTPWTGSYTEYTQMYPVVQIQWNFINPSRYPQIAAARHQLELSQSQLLQATQQTQFAIRDAFLQYLYWGYQVGEYNQLLSLQRQIVSDSNQRVQLQLLPKPDATQQFRILLSYQAQYQDALQQQRQAADQLDSLVFPLISSDNRSLADSSQSFDYLSLLPLMQPSLLTWNKDQTSSVRDAISYSEELKQLLLQSDIAIDNANEQWGAILPTVGLLGYVTYQYTVGSQSYSPPAQPNGAVSSTLGNYGGLSFSWNFFDGYATRNMAKSYEQQAKSFTAQYRQAATQLKVQVLNLLGQIKSSKELIVIGLQDLRAAEEISSNTIARAQVGLEGTYDVINSKIDIQTARLQLLQSLAAYTRAYYQLTELVGDSESDIPDVFGDPAPL